MNRSVYFILLVAILGTVSSSCGLRAYRREAKPSEYKAQVVYTPSTGNEKDFSVAKNFCLDDDTSIVKMTSPTIMVKSFQLLNRWGQVVMTTQGADFIPAKLFPVPPAAMSEMGVMTWRLSYVGSDGVSSHFQGNINYMGVKCKK